MATEGWSPKAAGSTSSSAWISMKLDGRNVILERFLIFGVDRVECIIIIIIMIVLFLKDNLIESVVLLF